MKAARTNAAHGGGNFGGRMLIVSNVRVVVDRVLVGEDKT